MHARDADAHAETPSGAAGRRHAPAIVADADDETSLDDLRADMHARGPGMAMDVGERLLHHPQDRTLDVRRSLVHGVGDPDARLQSRPPREPVDELPQRRLKSLAGEIGRVEEVGEDAQLQKRPIEQVRRSPRTTLKAAGLCRICPAKPHQPEIGRDEVLGRRVVQLAGDALALLLLQARAVAPRVR